MKFSILFFIVCVGVLLPCAFAQQAPLPNSQNASAVESAKYIGLRYSSSLPNGLENVGGSLVSDVNDAKAYSISQIHRGKVKMLWFELSNRNDSATPYSEVKDMLVLPEIRKNQILVSYSVCLLGNNLDREIVAIAYYQPDEEYFTRIRRAWRANRQTEKFEEIPTKGIKCENVGYGI